MIVDDGSTDNTKQVVARYGSKVQYYKIKNQGVSNARNYGAAKAKGKYIVFLDADDKLYPNFIRKTLGLLQQQNESVGFIYTQMQHFEASDYLTQYPGYSLPYLKVSNFINACTLVKTELVRKYPYDTRITVWEDWDFYLTLAENGIIGALINEPLIYYRKHSNGGSALDTFDAAKKLYSSHMLRTKHWRMYGYTDTVYHWIWYGYNRFKQLRQGKDYAVKSPDDRTGPQNKQ